MPTLHLYCKGNAMSTELDVTKMSPEQLQALVLELLKKVQTAESLIESGTNIYLSTAKDMVCVKLAGSNRILSFYPNEIMQLKREVIMERMATVADMVPKDLPKIDKRAIREERAKIGSIFNKTAESATAR
jgi:hypothetical protein